MKPRHYWTAQEIAVLRARYADEATAAIGEDLHRAPRSVYAKANELGLRKSAAFYALPLSGRLRPGARLGGSTRFKPGHQTWNKGTHFKAGGRSVQTQFKKGERRGRANLNYKPIGTYRLSKDGYLQRKVTDAGTCNREYARRWVNVHRLVWQAAHGRIPRGHVVWFKPGQRTAVLDEITADRLECITNAESMRRNSIHTRYPPEVAKLIQLRGVLTRKLNTKEQHEKPND